MDKELSLKIEFSDKLTENQLMDFWDFLIDQIEKLHLKAGGGLDGLKLNWVIDYSDSLLGKGEVIDRLSEIVMIKDELILNFRIK